MKQFLSLIRRFIPPYKKFLFGNLALNLLAQILNVFSFALLIPILQILFQVSDTQYEYMTFADGNIADVIKNNFYYYMNTFIETRGALWVLMASGVILIVMTLLKTACYFGSAATLIPLRTGVVRDIRIQVYNKVMGLPLSFFSEERKGDIISRMSSDVSGLETSLSNSLEMLI
ncbi:MAG: ABC transporter ATP-binding protein, partial [Bacteroidaceae bacterium]|nr:ABC transporter ATP-binding protein [Bacteroidaceae bacterium]